MGNAIRYNLDDLLLFEPLPVSTVCGVHIVDKIVHMELAELIYVIPLQR